MLLMFFEANISLVSAQLCNEDVMPRNHCLKCGRCTDYRNSHCEVKPI